MVRVPGSVVQALVLALLLAVAVPAAADHDCAPDNTTCETLGGLIGNETHEEDEDPLAALQGQADGKLPVDADAPGLLDRLLASTGQFLGDAASAIGGGLAKGAKAVWSGITFLVEGLADGVGAVSLAGGAAAAVVGAGLVAAATAGSGWGADGATGAATALVAAIVSLAAALGTGASFLAGGVADAVTFLATGLADAVASLARSFMGARPDDVPTGAWAAIGATGATVAVGAPSGGAWWLWRRIGGVAGLGAMPLFSRIAKSDLLDHPMRAQIYEVIRENPGVHISEISRRLDVGWGTTIHHLRKLRSEKLVAIRQVNNQKCYFLTGAVNASEMMAVGELKHPTARAIALYIGANPGKTVGEISAVLALTPSLVSFHVSKLEEAGLTTKVRDGRFVRVMPTALATQRLLPGVTPQGGVPETAAA